MKNRDALSGDGRNRIFQRLAALKIQKKPPQATILTLIRSKSIQFSIGIVVLLTAYFGPSAYRKAQADKEVDRLCALNGGVKLFENVQLPAENFDQFGNPMVPLSTSKIGGSGAVNS